MSSRVKKDRRRRQAEERARQYRASKALLERAWAKYGLRVYVGPEEQAPVHPLTMQAIDQMWDDAERVQREEEARCLPNPAPPAE